MKKISTQKSVTKCRLYPTKKTEEIMLEHLNIYRCGYNTMLGMLNEQKVIDKNMIQNTIPDMKICDIEFSKVNAKALQMQHQKLFSNLSGLSASKKKGKKVGRLRFKGKGWFKTFIYNQSGYKIINTGKRLQTLWLSKIGNIPIRVHRNIKGNIKQITIKKEQSGKWYASIITETKTTILKKKITSIVGIDVGLDNYTWDSNNNFLKNPRILKNNEKKLKHRQRVLSKKSKGSMNRNKQRIIVAKQHEKIANIRDDFIHKLSRYYVDKFDVIGFEDMPMTVLKDIYAKNKLDVAWGKFRQYTKYKAESAGKWYVEVDYKRTTTECNKCGEQVPKHISERIHKCSKCGIEIPRDYNSSLVIKNRVIEILQKQLGQELSEYKLLENPLMRNSLSSNHDLMNEEAISSIQFS